MSIYIYIYIWLCIAAKKNCKELTYGNIMDTMDGLDTKRDENKNINQYKPALTKYWTENIYFYHNHN